MTPSKDLALEGAAALGLAGALAVGGLVSQLAAVVPAQVGSVAWEFGALGEVAATGPLLLIGFAALVFVATRWRRTGLLLGTGMVGVTWGVLLGLAVILLALDTPLVLNAARAVSQEESRSVKTVLAKSAILLVVEAAAMLAMGLQSYRWRRRIWQLSQ